MTTTIEKRPRGGLSKTSRQSIDINRRIERAWQSRCAKVERADVDYRDQVRAIVNGDQDDQLMNRVAEAQIADADAIA